jgi:2'-5' RNA ligase
MRLFIALGLPAELLHELARCQAQFRELPLRLADPAGLHLTLQFLGEVDAGLAPALLASIDALPPAPFELRLAGLGGFPDLRSTRVLWAGLGGDLGALARLQAAVLAATAPLGFRPEERPFRPHLTLGRVRPTAGPGERRAVGAAIAGAAPPVPLAWQAGAPQLYESTLTPSGAVYRALRASGA